ncbi:hypothetical protein [Saccharopolyspora sp. NPDC002376]
MFSLVSALVKLVGSALLGFPEDLVDLRGMSPKCSPRSRQLVVLFETLRCLSFQHLAETIKNAVDPNHVIAPARYGIGL